MIKRIGLAATFAVASTAASAATVDVLGTASVFDAGGGSTSGVSISVTGGDVITFNPITGLVDCCTSSVGNSGPDGLDNLIGGQNTDINGANGRSGIFAAGRQLFLAGVFVDGGAGGTATELSFGTVGGVSYNDASYSHDLFQTFFIGDGLTGDNTLNTIAGAVQSFIAPTGATELILGIADAGAFTGNPAFYGDNDGSYSVTYQINGDPMTPVPLPAGLPLLLAGLGGFALMRRKS